MQQQSNNMMYQMKSHEMGQQRPFQSDGKILEFEIILYKQNENDEFNIFHPGETINGHVRLFLRDKMAVTKLDLIIQGTGNVSWEVKNPQTGRYICNDDEVYLNELAELIFKNNMEYVTLSKGEHIFPFSCDLPENIPASFTGNNGNISYIAKTVLQAEAVERSYHQPVIVTELFFVEDHINPADHAEFFKSYRQDLKTNLNAGSAFKIGPNSLKVSLFLPRRAYDVNDKIIINVDVANGTKKTVRNMGVALVMSIGYKALNEYKSEKLIVTDREDGYTFGYKEGRKWRNIDLAIPPMIPPSGLPFSNVISVAYHIVFKIEVVGQAYDVIMRVPIIVGAAIDDIYKPGFNVGINNADNGFRTPSMRTSRAPSAAASYKKNSTTYLTSQQSEIQEIQPSIQYRSSKRSNVQLNGRSSDDYPSIPTKDYSSSIYDYKATREPIDVEIQNAPARLSTNNRQQETDTHSITMKFSDMDSPIQERMTRNPLFREEGGTNVASTSKDLKQPKAHQVDNNLLFTKINDTSYYDDSRKHDVLY